MQQPPPPCHLRQQRDDDQHPADDDDDDDDDEDDDYIFELVFVAAICTLFIYRNTVYLLFNSVIFECEHKGLIGYSTAYNKV